MNNTYKSQIFEDWEKIFSNKKIDINSKGQLILQAYKAYMHNGLLEKETKNLVETGYANSYMKNGKKDEYVYQDIYVNEEDNLLFYHAITMFKYLMQIKLNGGNFNNVPNADKSIILSLAMIDDMMGNYNHKTEFFFCDSKARRNIANKLVNFKSSAKIASYKTFENTQNK